jgi:beta-ureidopropionase / N-carbamoyl-L-amino-acid hydrolase
MPDQLTNQARLWDSLMEVAKIGATEKGGSRRLALTDLDREARDLFVGWCREAGCTVSVDAMGNIFARREGTDPTLAPVLAGSHLDTQPNGGRFDGVFGVLAALEAVRTLNDQEIQTERAVEIVDWTNEEGSRFAPAMVASGVFAGAFDLDYGLSRPDASGRTLGEALGDIGYAGEVPVGARPIAAYVEAHIEQGPILEGEAKTIGVVQGAQAQRWYEVTLTGQDAHAGTTPMERRHDALVTAASIITEVNRIGVSVEDGRATVGMMEVGPNSRNTIPGACFFTVDMRHPDEDVLLGMGTTLREYAAGIASANGVEIDLREIWHSPLVKFDRRCVQAVQAGAEAAGLPFMEISSGAGHDACYISRVAPTAMIFVPCADGISHNELESATPEDIGAGAEVLFRALVELAKA